MYSRYNNQNHGYHSIRPNTQRRSELQDFSVCWSFLPFTKQHNAHDAKGKVRPVVVTHDFGEMVQVLPITSKYYSKAPSIRKWYYPLHNWRHHGLHCPSYVDLHQKFEIPKNYFLRSESHHLSHNDCIRLLSAGIHLQKLRLRHLEITRNHMAHEFGFHSSYVPNHNHFNHHYHHHYYNNGHHFNHGFHHKWSHHTRWHQYHNQNHHRRYQFRKPYHHNSQSSRRIQSHRLSHGIQW